MGYTVTCHFPMYVYFTGCSFRMLSCSIVSHVMYASILLIGFILGWFWFVFLDMYFLKMSFIYRIVCLCCRSFLCAVSVCAGWGERERGRERERERERANERDRDRQREIDRETDRETDR